MATANQIRYIQELHTECEGLGLNPEPLPDMLTTLNTPQVSKILDGLKALKTAHPRGQLLTSKQESFLIILHGGADCPSLERERIRLLDKESAFKEIAHLTDKSQKVKKPAARKPQSLPEEEPEHIPAQSDDVPWSRTRPVSAIPMDLSRLDFADILG